MPTNDGGVSKKLAGAKAALSSAYNSNVSAPKPTAVPQQGAGHAIGKGFADAHGSDHTGATRSNNSQEVNSVGEGLKARADQIKANPELTLNQ